MKKFEKIIPFEIKQVDEDSRSFTAVASTEDVDRDGDIIRASGWELDEFLKNPVIPWAHDYKRPPVAQALEVWVEKNQLMFTPKFPTAEEYEFADTVYKLYKGRYLRSFSVGFNPIEYKPRPGGKGREFTRQKLWEISACVLPSNPNALVAAKAAGIPVSACMEKDLLGVRLGEMKRENEKLLEINAEQVADIGYLRHRNEVLERKVKSLTPRKAPITHAELQKIAEDVVGQRLSGVADKRLKYYLGIVSD